MLVFVVVLVPTRMTSVTGFLINLDLILVRLTILPLCRTNSVGHCTDAADPRLVDLGVTLVQLARLLADGVVVHLDLLGLGLDVDAGEGELRAVDADGRSGWRSTCRHGRR